jgi:hypothetical protein
MEEKKTSGTTVVVIVVAVSLFFIQMFVYGLKGGSVDFIFNIFRSKSDKCKTEAFDRAVSVRDKELEGLKLKENPTPQDIAEIERLEIQKKTEVVDREDNNYFYEECMK